MKKVLLWSAVIAIAVGVCTWLVLKPEKDYRRLALGDWLEAKNQTRVDITDCHIEVSLAHGKKEVVDYIFYPDRSPMEIEFWYGKAYQGPYFAYVEFDGDDKIIVRKKPSELDKGDYFLERANFYEVVLNRVKKPWQDLQMRGYDF